MTIAEKLKRAQKKAKTAIVTGALAVAAVTAPIKGQSAEVTSDKVTAQTTEVTPVQKQRQQLFEAAVRAHMPKEEIAKYVDFPEFLPVNKNGQLDEAKLKPLLHDSVTNRLDAVKEFYENIAPTHRYTGGMTFGEQGSQAFNKAGYDKALTTFFKEIAGDSKEASKLLKKIADATSDNWTRMADRADSKYIVGNFRGGEGPGTAFIVLGLVGAFFGGIGVAGSFGSKDTKAKVYSSLILASSILAMAYGVKDIASNRGIINERLSDPKAALTFLEEGAQKAYDIYLTEMIQTEKDRQETIAKEQFAHQAKTVALKENR